MNETYITNDNRIFIFINGEEHQVVETRPCDVEETHQRPTRAECAAHSRRTYTERQNVAALDEVLTVSVPSTDLTYYNNGERKTYCVTTVDAVAVACTCPDFHFRRRICKHMVTVGTYDDKGSAIL